MDESHKANLSATPAHESIPAETTFHVLPKPAPNPINPPNPSPPHTNPLPNIYIAPPTPLMAPPMTHKIGSLKFNAPHPLLYLCLLMSFLALILEVPKGSLPTLTGRHKNLRVQERLVQERLQLLTRLSGFLPPPLAQLIPHTGESMKISQVEEYIRGVRVWGGEGKWWNVEELGGGASLVKSKTEGGAEREVWVLKMGNGQDEGQNPLLSALTHSLILRDQLLSDLAALKSGTSHAPTGLIPGGTQTPLIEGRNHFDEEGTRRIDEWRKREKERESEVDERERDVARREQWVVEEMRKLSDRVHSQATELTLEDRITERLKAYQRQLAQLHGGDEQV